MKNIALSLTFLFIFVNSSQSQINNIKHYKEILEQPLDVYIKIEIDRLNAVLNTSPYQEKKIIEEIILYYIKLRKIDNTTLIKKNNSCKLTGKFNYAEHNYLISVEELLSTNQKQLFDKYIYSNINKTEYIKMLKNYTFQSH